MDSQSYESSQFYSYKFKNFSTIIILPATILILILFISSFFTVRQNTISSTGTIEPRSVLNIVGNYHEGQYIKKGTKVKLTTYKAVKSKQDAIVHLDDKKEEVGHLLPKIKRNNKLQLVTYFPGNKISIIKRGQTMYFNISNSQGTTTRLIGKVQNVAVYPVNIHNQSLYEVIGEVNAKNVSVLRYGMQGDITVITGQTTYFEYWKSKLLDK